MSEVTRHVGSREELLESSYHKWNSIILEMDNLRMDSGLYHRLSSETGILMPKIITTLDPNYIPSPGEFVITQSAGFENKLLLGHSSLNVGGVFKTTGGNREDILEIGIGNKPGSGTQDQVVFVEMWREEVFPGDVIYYNGLYPVEQERISVEDYLLVVHWRIRTVVGVNITVDPMLDSQVKVLANNQNPTAIGYVKTSTDNLYVGEDNSLDVFNNQVFATPLLTVTRSSSETYVSENNVVYIGGSLGPIKHAKAHSTGGDDEVTPESIGAVPISSVNQPNGVAGLDENGKLDVGYMGDVAEHGNVSHTDNYATEENLSSVGSSVTTLSENMNSHISNTTNPHSVTASQLSAVPTSRRVDSGTGLSGGGSLGSNLNLSLNVEYTDNRYAAKTHVNNTSNPHGVTKTQVGLGNVRDLRQVPMNDSLRITHSVFAFDMNSSVAVLRNISYGDVDPLNANGNDGEVYFKIKL